MRRCSCGHGFGYHYMTQDPFNRPGGGCSLCGCWEYATEREVMSCHTEDCGKADCPVCKWSRDEMPGNREVQQLLEEQRKTRKKGKNEHA